MRLVIIFLLCSFLFSSAARADQLADGLAALDNGDFPAALKLLKPLSDSAHPEAQYYMCAMYSRGTGVPRDYKKAIKLCRLSAAQGYSYAQYFMGILYRDGSGVKKDTAQAFKWFHKAAEQGLPEAQASLGAMYANGHGVKQHRVEAYMWVAIALDNIEDDVETETSLKREIDTLSRDMGKEQIDEAKRLAEDWTEAHRHSAKVSPKLFLVLFLLPAFVISFLPGRQRKFDFYYRIFAWLALLTVLFGPLFFVLCKTGLILTPETVYAAIWPACCGLMILFAGWCCSSPEVSYLDGLMYVMACVTGSSGTRIIIGVPLLIITLILSVAISVFYCLIGKRELAPRAYHKMIDYIYKYRMDQ